MLAKRTFPGPEKRLIQWAWSQACDAALPASTSDNPQYRFSAEPTLRSQTLGQQGLQVPKFSPLARHTDLLPQHHPRGLTHARSHGSVGELSDGLNGLLPGRRGPPKAQHGGRQGALHQGQCRAGAPGTPNPEPRGGKERAVGREGDTRRRREGGAAGGAGPTGWRRALGERAGAARREERGERGPQPPPPRASRASRAQQFPQSCRRGGAQPAGDTALARRA